MSSGLPTFGHRGVGFQFGRTASTRVSSTPPPHSPIQSAGSAGSGLPYGSVSAVTDPQRRGRERERDRERLLSGRPLLMRLDKMGPQETADWNEWMDNTTNRIETLERQQRSHGQTLGSTIGDITSIKNTAKPVFEDIPMYKEYVEKRFANTQDIVVNQFTNIDGRFDVVQGNFDVFDNKIKSCEAGLTAIASLATEVQAQFVN